MENFPRRISFDGDKALSAFMNPLTYYSDALDVSKVAKIENLVSSNHGNYDFRKRRLSSFDHTSFFNFSKDDERPSEMNESVKTEAYSSDYPNFPQMQMDPIDYPVPTKFQDYAVDYYRITRSRGPSFNIIPGRKTSEDLFANSFDILSYFRNQEQNEKAPINENTEHRPQTNFLDEFRSLPLVPIVLPTAREEANIQHDEVEDSKDSVIDQQIAAQQQPSQEEIPDKEDSKTYGELEPKNKKKRKLNNAQEATNQETINASPLKIKKARSEVAKKSANITETLSNTLAVSKNPSMGKPTSKKSEGPKTPKSKKKKKDGSEGQNAKDGKSTQFPMPAASPNHQKKDLASFLTSNSEVPFPHFKKPETAQELLGGLSLPAEVEEYINKSKIFNQLKAPVIRRIGTLTLEERRIKLEKYFEKRKRRTWNKRVNYDCRKKVADNRLRIKGRFVTKEQAFVMLESYGIVFNPETITNTEIKDILTEKFGSAIPKKKIVTEGLNTNLVSDFMLTNEKHYEGSDGEHDNNSSCDSQDEVVGQYEKSYLNGNYI